MAVPINSNDYDMTKAKPLTASDAAQTHFVLMQCSRPLNADDDKQLLAKKIHIEAYLDEETYTCYFEQADLVLEAAKLTFVKIITAFPTALKIRAELLGDLQANPPASAAQNKTTRRVVITLHSEDPTPYADVKRKVLAVGNAKMVSEPPDNFVIEIEQGALSALTAIDSIVSIGDERLPETGVEWSRSILYGNLPPRGSPMLGVVSVAPNIIWPEGLDGTGQVITVADTGIDPDHPAFTGRLACKTSVGSMSGGDDFGHGTHVAGCALGNGTTRDGCFVRGIAHNAQLASIQLLINTAESELPGRARFVPTSPKTLIDLTLHIPRPPPYSPLGSYVHNWSFYQSLGGYDETAKRLDLCLENYPDVTICICAGNNGKEAEKWLISGSPAAKNAITVGGCDTSSKGYRAGGKTIPNLADFSSRGKEKPGALKPDVVAPAVEILSAAPKNAEFQEAATIAIGMRLVPVLPLPMVAGCVAILRQAFFKHHATYQDPAIAEKSPAGIDRFLWPRSDLFKALLINSTIDLQGAQYQGDRISAAPNAYQGHGLVQLPAALRPLLPPAANAPAANAPAGFANGVVLDIGPANRASRPAIGHAGIAVPNDGHTYRLAATIAWIDPAETTLQNSLQLVVCRTLAGKDTEQTYKSKYTNVIKAIIPAVPAGAALRFLVEGVRLTKKPQWFSLVYTLTRNP
ncbi:peptidase S8/S53 domain-containing protein [Neohortaea acidophila]|uniref:Peptidase S8/S53 domain-containing protein n=1 Tax=Neohortaea acidophila TaxID=245834 RepID=A0A6A6Q4G0_9PEZI|nr:peptidase S8/S53 domain-containing protein [Neohortaea acidophila]KAF2486909.1 peptidase S8/S53 domain-containing protein [Neohortaea acidophila]